MTNQEETVQEENDILSVAEGLRADAVSEDSEVSTQEDSDNQVDEGESAGSPDQTDSESISEDADSEEQSEETANAEEEETSDTDANEDQSLVESGETPDAVDDQDDLNENAEESSETSNEEVSDQSEELQSEAAKYEEQIESLKAENAKLKQHLHFMLAERVVDAKISVGYVSAENRKEAILEHEKRTASSLADALKDLQELSFTTTTSTKHDNKNLIDVKTQAVEGEDNAVTDDLETETKIVASAEDQLIDRFAQVLIGRNKL